MTFVEKFLSLLFIPTSCWHLFVVQRALKNNSYQDLLRNKPKFFFNFSTINVVVKSYFWSCRLIPHCKCLPRSIALYQKLSSLGYNVKHKFGVVTSNPEDKLAAHAWVEYRGKALNESKNLSQFTVLENNNDANK